MHTFYGEGTKKYLLFAYGNYYPSGGMYDYEGSFDTIDECKEAAKKVRLDDWGSYQIVEYETLKIVWRGDIDDERVIKWAIAVD